MDETFENEIVTVLDDDGNEHMFELLDAIENDEGRYVALLPVYAETEQPLAEEDELVILEVADQDGEDLLVPIMDDDTFEEIAGIFQERLSELYQVDVVEEHPDGPVS